MAALAWVGAARSQSDSPVGLWITLDDSSGKPEARVRIDERNGEFFGTVVDVFSATTPNPVCEVCEGALKDKPIIGMTILRGLRRDGNGYGGGTILDPDEGRYYQCTIALLDDGRKLELRGYIVSPWLGRTQTWIRGK
jgi:uncharacterized protein (DUF2147 family)